ncbi:MAG: aldehyde dehydrogenase family protein, partial [Acidimicrobiales bacterium]
NALAYLARRLDENATPEGFLRRGFAMLPGSLAWADQSRRFEEALRARSDVATDRRHDQDRQRRSGGPNAHGRPDPTWRNEPDTDLTVPANRRWVLESLAAGGQWSRDTSSSDSSTEAAVRAIDVAAREAPMWAASTSAERRPLLMAAAEVMARRRRDAVAVMASEAYKTFAEADPEISEAVDYARWYARSAALTDAFADTVDSVPLGVVVVAPPWNFPYAIAAGGVLAALAAGNTVILKPSPQVPATSELLADQLWSAGFSNEQVQVVHAADGPAGRSLVSDRRVGAVILTGSLETAHRFLGWAPQRRLLAETSGKNAMVVAGTADVDQAVGDLVRSAFGHAGQKCSAASLAIVDASIHDRSPFLRQLADAVRSLRVGRAADPRTEVGPIVGPRTPALDRALTRLDPGESWLVAPEELDPDRRLWSPGVRIGVRPGSWAHMTEWFGPVLAVMRTENLREAVRLQNAVPFGLTAGLQSLDPVEHSEWADAVEAGNLYINRSTTGAIVGRQPFGGWKASSVGPTAKAGGPNYLVGLRRWSDRGAVGVEQATASYREWWDGYFSRRLDLAGLGAEANVLRYRAFNPGVVLRAVPDVADDQIAKAVAAATITGTPLLVSSMRPRRGLTATLARAGCSMEVETAGSFASRIAGAHGSRLRLLGPPEPEVVGAASKEGLSVWDEPVCSHGRIELVRWVREQSVSRSVHRYGTIVYEERRESAGDPIGLRLGG